MPEIAKMSPWKRFWERGGWWKAVILVVAYYAIYQLLGFASVPFNGMFDADSAGAILTGIALPIFLVSLVLVGFAVSVGWLRELFGPQPIRGGWWMWIAVGAVLLFNILRFATTDYSEVNFGYVLAWIITGLCIGFAEEVVTRGFVVNLMRKAGHKEIVVALVSAALFAAMHAGNFFGGQGLIPTLLQVGYTFAFGLCMYLTLRVTGNLIWPILLHASTDPSIFMQVEHPADGSLTALAGLGNIVVIITGLVLAFFIRGRIAARESDLALTPTTAPLA